MALSLFALVAFGLLFGPVGIILATPLTLIAMVLVLSLYVRDVLGDDISLPGEPKASPPRKVAAPAI
jgi:predicted PurR-regulated permease PerM